MADPSINQGTPPPPSSPPPAKRLSGLLLTFLKIAIAILAFWWVLRGVSWHDSATLAAGSQIRDITFNQDLDVRVLGQTPLPSGTALLHVQFPDHPVKLHVDTGKGPMDVEMTISTEAIVPGTNEQLGLDHEIDLPPALFKKTGDQIVHEGLQTLAQHASSRWELLLGAWILLGIPFFITAIRWRALMVPQGIKMPLGKCLQLTFVGQFYSIILPGITGGDLVKIVYAARLTGSKTKSFITIILDRVIGLVALMVIAGVSAGVQLLLNRRQGIQLDGTLFNVFLMIVILLAGLAAGSTVYFSRRLRRLAGIDWFIEHLTELSDADDAHSQEHQKLERLFRLTNGTILALALLAVVALILLRWQFRLAWAMNNLPLIITGLVLAGLAAAGAAAGLALHHALVHRATPLLRRAMAALLGIDETMHVYRGHFGLLGWAFFISLISQATLPLSAWLSGAAFGMHAPVTYYLAYLPIAVLAVSLPISPPQGLGVLEGVLHHFFVDRGAANASQVFALAQCVRFLPIIWNLVGAYWVVTGQYSRKESADASERRTIESLNH